MLEYLLQMSHNLMIDKFMALVTRPEIRLHNSKQLCIKKGLGKRWRFSVMLKADT